MVTDEQLDARLVRADRAREVPVETRSLDDLALAARAEARRRGRRRITGGAVAGGALALALVAGGFAAAPAVGEAIRAFIAQTGIVPGEEEAGSEVAPGSEWIDTSASDLRDYIESIYPAWLPLAPGQDRAALIDQVTGERAANPGMQQEVGIRLRFEWLVMDAWLDEWIAAHSVGDAGREVKAMNVLLESRDWPASVASDGGGVHTMHVLLIDRMAAGDAEAAQVFAQMENTVGWDRVDRSPQIEALICDWARTTGGHAVCKADMTEEMMP